MRTFQLFAAVMLVVLVCVWWILTTEAQLPTRVVTKWTNGVATNFMTRAQWLTAAAGMVVAVGVVLSCVAALATRFPRSARVGAVTLTAAAQAWLRARRQGAFFMLAALHVLWMTWFHWMVLQANRLQPPHLSATPIAVWVIAQLAVVMCFVAYMFCTTLRARRMPS